MSKCAVTLGAAVLSVALFGSAAANQAESYSLPTAGVGFQFSFPAWGLSGKYNVSNHVTAQGVFGIVGDLKMYGGRMLYHFNRRERSSTYCYGMVGGFSYKGIAISDDDWKWEETTETVLGLGAGAGVEYSFPGLPEIGWSLEIGFSRVDFDEVDYNFTAFMLGVGAHYFF